MSHRLAVDVGGTFIDFALLDENTGELVIEKQPASPTTLVEEFLAGARRLPVALGEIERLFHGTTAGINAVIQARGAKVGLITTAGFRDVLEIGRGSRPEIYDALYLPPKPLVPRYLRREVPERLKADGSVILPLDEAALDREVDYLVEQGVEAVAICFLHAYANPKHEQQAAARVRERHPELSVTASHEVATEWREFERTSTTVLNAYIQPLMGRYLGELGADLVRSGYSRPFALMQSNGGVISADRAAQRPIRTIESGPAGGVIGAQALARELGYPNVVCADVGGTSFDVALIEDGRILETTQTEIGRRPVVGPIIDIVSIGAGGGSIAWIDDLGAVRVGPQSAGAYPGPACFGHGGTDPTVTDCHLLLGRLDPDNFLGSRMKLDVEAAEQALRTRLAEPTGLDIEAAADGALSIAETNMVFAIRAVTVERGLDPREFVIFCYGGGGGLFAAAVAEELEVPTVIIPRAPANFSAWGILTSDYREDTSLTRVQPLDAASAGAATQGLHRLAEEAATELHGYGFGDDEIELLHRVDVRYAGQDHTITVPVEASWLDDRDALLEGVRERFVAAHTQLYGHGTLDPPLELVTSRARGVGRVARPPFADDSPPSGATGPRSQRDVYFRGLGRVETPVYDRETLTAVDGPAIVEEWTTTIVIPLGWAARSDRLGNLTLERA
jgi:N-methylhydantoinase A